MDLTKMGFRADYDEKNRIVKQEHVMQNGKEYFISTVDLGLNYSFEEGKPLYFETMIFEKDSWHDLYCDRYETKEEASKKHKELVERILNNNFIIEEV